jgi:hypothetical protein
VEKESRVNNHDRFQPQEVPGGHTKFFFHMGPFSRFSMITSLRAFYEFHKEDLEKAKHHYQKYLDLGGADKRIQELMKLGRRT